MPRSKKGTSDPRNAAAGHLFPGRRKHRRRLAGANAKSPEVTQTVSQMAVPMTVRCRNFHDVEISVALKPPGDGGRA